MVSKKTNKSLLVLGSEGFIGKNCVKYYIQKGVNVFGVDLYEQASVKYFYSKITRFSQDFDELFANNFFDVIINAAGSGNVPYSMIHPVSDFEANVLDTIHILEAIRKYQTKAVYIHLSSAAVYGNPISLPIKETDLCQPLSPYGWHKSISEQLCQEYTNIYNLSTAIVRPFSVYGSGLKKQLFWDLFQKAQNSTNGEILELYGTGEESRDYIHIYDLIRGIDSIVEKGNLKGEVYNLASGNETYIKQSVKIFLDIVAPTVQYSFNGKVRIGDPINWRADVSKLTAIGFAPILTLQKGLEEMANWLKTL